MDESWKLVVKMEVGWNWFRIISNGRFFVSTVELSGSITTKLVTWLFIAVS
jgi:hypothetical protein